VSDDSNTLVNGYGRKDQARMFVASESMTTRLELSPEFANESDAVPSSCASEAGR